MPSICAVASWSHPITSAMRGSAARLPYLRVLVSVSNTISQASLTPKPTTAAWGAPPAALAVGRPAGGHRRPHGQPVAAQEAHQLGPRHARLIRHGVRTRLWLP